jgi:Tfp pilus assembly protein PilV
MFNSLCNKKGITLIEVMVSLVLITVGILSLLTLLPSGIRLSGTSDLLGRAAGILQAELNMNEILVMNENNTVTATVAGVPLTKTVYGSGKGIPQQGDIAYTVRTQRSDLGGRWLVQVQVNWPGNANGIGESLIVTRQKYFAQ